MFSKPWVRCLVCLLMVCVLLINCSPIKAKASMTGTIAIGAGIAIASALIGLGVCAASDPSGFDGVVESCQSFLADAGYVVNGLINVVSLSDPTAMYRYAVDQDLIDTIRGWLFGAGSVVSLVPVAKTSFSYSSGGTSYRIDSDSDICVFAIDEYVSGKLYTVVYACSGADDSASYDKYIDGAFSMSSKTTYSSSYGGYFNFLGNNFALSSVSGVSHFGVASTSAEKKAIFNSVVSRFGTSEIITNVAVALASIAAPAYALAEGYAEWATNALSVPGADVGKTDEDEVIVYPVGLGQTYEETRDYAQTDVWAGTSTYEEATTDTGVAGDTVTATGLKGWLDAMLTAIGGWFADVISGLRDIGASITSLPQAIADAVLAGITAIFVPSADFLTAKVEAIRAEFSFADSIISTVEYLKGALSGLSLEPPVIYLNLADSRGSYYLGGKVAILDLRWYAEYKPVGDAILSAFLWLAFVWRIFMKLPGIISGMPGDFVMKGFESAGLDSKLPSRSLEYAAKRADLNDKVSARRTIFKKGSGK